MTRGMAWFPRMLDKIRLHARGELPPDYIPWLRRRVSWQNDEIIEQGQDKKA